MDFAFVFGFSRLPPPDGKWKAAVSGLEHAWIGSLLHVWGRYDRLVALHLALANDVGAANVKIVISGPMEHQSNPQDLSCAIGFADLPIGHKKFLVKTAMMCDIAVRGLAKHAGESTDTMAFAIRNVIRDQFGEDIPEGKIHELLENFEDIAKNNPDNWSFND